MLAQFQLNRLEADAARRPFTQGRQKALKRVTASEVQHALRGMTIDVGTGKDVQGLRQHFLQLLEASSWIWKSGEVLVRYRIPAIGGLTGLQLASPRGFEPRLPP